MTNYSPSTLFLKELHDRLEVLAIPIYFYLPNSDVSGCVISVHSITPSLIRFHQHNDTSVNLNQEKIQLFSVFFSIFIENVAVFRKWLHSV